MFYTIYKITNTINGKFYIGKHQTKDLNDGYMGSGKRLKNAIKHYGIENFHKEILHIFSSEKEMNLAEKILVVTDNEISYNLCEGGKGGFGYINKSLCLQKKGREAANKKIFEKYGVHNVSTLDSIKRKISLSQKKRIEKNPEKYKKIFYDWTGKKHKEETKQKIGLANKKSVGKLNSQYGTMWITNGKENRKISKNDLDIWLKRGYNKGRINGNQKVPPMEFAVAP